MQSKAQTVEAYLASLPPDRREAVRVVRATILKNLDKGFQETMQYGMIGYSVPHSLFPPGYHCDPTQPLPYAGLASQKNHLSVYLMGLYVGATDTKPTPLVSWFIKAWKDSGKKLDMGKCCVRFKRVEDLPLDVLGEAVRRLRLKEYVELYQHSLDNRVSTGSPAKKAAKKATTKSTNTKSTKKTVR